MNEFYFYYPQITKIVPLVIVLVPVCEVKMYGIASKKMYDDVKVEIVEQPASNKMRFRYSCEGRSAGSIVGENSTKEEKTYPAIKVYNYSGSAVVCVSCVEIGPQPYR